MRGLFAAAFVVVLACSVSADDWPQWMGAQRDNVWRETGVLKKFPEGGPKVLWRTPIAGGYAGPAVVGDRVFVTDYVTSDNVKVDNFSRKEFTGTERVMCLNATSGDVIWQHEYPVTYGISYPAGPRCTPTVESGMVYALGAEGNLFCFNAESGEIIWSRDLKKEYKTKSALWGYASHPLIDGDKLICVVGGTGSHAVAFNKTTGEEIWKTLTSSEQGYSPPTIIRSAGVRQLILLNPDAVASVDPETGRPFWSVDYQASNGSVIMSPIQSGNLLFAGGYSNKSLLLELGQDQPSAEVLWRDEVKSALSPVNVQPFLDGDYLYGFHQGGELMCVELKSGKRIWESNEPLSTRRAKGSGTAFIVKNGGSFLLFNEMGELIIAELSPEGYKEIDRAKVIEPTNLAFGRRVVWSAPAYAGKKAFIRNDSECICVDLSAE